MAPLPLLYLYPPTQPQGSDRLITCRIHSFHHVNEFKTNSIQSSKRCSIVVSATRWDCRWQATSPQATPSISANEALDKTDALYDRFGDKSNIESTQTTIERCETLSNRSVSGGRALDHFHCWERVFNHITRFRKRLCSNTVLVESRESEWRASIRNDIIVNGLGKRN